MGLRRREADQFPARGEAFPFPTPVHQRQTPATVAPNPMRFSRQRERQGQANFQQTTFDVTIHHLKRNLGDRASLAANCRSLRISCPKIGINGGGGGSTEFHLLLSGYEIHTKV
jgi:hypothetical protein